MINYLFSWFCKSHIVSIVLPANEDACYYRLKLSILPGCYYQEAVSFTVDQVGLDEFCEPKWVDWNIIIYRVKGEVGKSFKL